MKREVFDSPEPWKSKYKIYSKAIITVIGSILIIIGFSLYFIFPYSIFYVLLPIVIILIGCGIYLISAFIYFYYNERNIWFLELPPDKNLFEKLNNKIEQLLNSKKYDFKKVHGTIGYQKGDFIIRKDPGIIDYIIKIYNAPDVIIETELRSVGHQETISINSNFIIKNIQPGNLFHVKNLSNELIIILNELNYKHYFKNK